MIKKIALISAVILVLLSAGLFYVNRVLLPVQIKGLVIKAAEDALRGRTVSESAAAPAAARASTMNARICRHCLPELSRMFPGPNR